jgi:hypothetical protein
LRWNMCRPTISPPKYAATWCPTWKTWPRWRYVPYHFGAGPHTGTLKHCLLTADLSRHRRVRLPMPRHAGLIRGLGVQHAVRCRPLLWRRVECIITPRCKAQQQPAIRHPAGIVYLPNVTAAERPLVEATRSMELNASVQVRLLLTR